MAIWYYIMYLKGALVLYSVFEGVLALFSVLMGLLVFFGSASAPAVTRAGAQRVARGVAAGGLHEARLERAEDGGALGLRDRVDVEAAQRPGQCRARGCLTKTQNVRIFREL